MQADSKIAADLRLERNHIARHASTILVGQLAVMFFAVADSIMAGRFSSQALAAFSVATAIYASVFVGTMGVLTALMPIYAEHRGANRLAAIGAAWRQGLYLLGALSALGMFCLLNSDPLLDLANVPADMRSDIHAYLGIQALTLPLALWFRSFMTVSQAIGRPNVVMWIQLASLPIKVGLSAWLVFGGIGLEPMGAQGCALGSLVVTAVMAVVGSIVLFRTEGYRTIAAWAPMEAPNWPQLKAFVRIGVPSGMAMLFEVTSFALMAVLIARLGVVAVGAHQVAVNVAAVMFMVPLSWSIAASARVSYWIGAQQHGFAKKVAWLSYRLTIAWALIGAVILWLLSPFIAASYSTDTQVLAMAAQLLRWVCLYQAVDAIQTLCVFVLRSYRVTVVPFLVYAIVLWGMGLGGGVALTFHGVAHWPAMQSPDGFWLAASVALVATALIFSAMLQHALSQATDQSPNRT